MERITISALYADAEQLGGQKVTVAGWVRSVRDMKNFGFVTLNDGSCFKDLQVVMNRENLGNYEEVASCGVGANLTQPSRHAIKHRAIKHLSAIRLN